MSTIYITKDAYAKIMALVKECDYEINGIGRVICENGDFTIDDIHVLKQKVTAASCEMDTEDLANFLATRDDYQDWKLQWHSHVNMGVFWSGTDESAIKTIGETASWVMSIVFNKRGLSKARIDAFNVTTTVPGPLQRLFKTESAQITEDDIDFRVLQAEEDDEVERWAKQMILEKVEEQRYTPPSWVKPTNEANAAGGKKNSRALGEGRGRSLHDQEREEALDELEAEFWADYAANHPEEGRPLLAVAKTPLAQIWQILATHLGETVTSLKEDYDDEAILDMYEAYLGFLNDETKSFLA